MVSQGWAEAHITAYKDWAFCSSGAHGKFHDVHFASEASDKD